MVLRPEPTHDGRSEIRTVNRRSAARNLGRDGNAPTRNMRRVPRVSEADRRNKKSGGNPDNKSQQQDGGGNDHRKTDDTGAGEQGTTTGGGQRDHANRNTRTIIYAGRTSCENPVAKQRAGPRIQGKGVRVSTQTISQSVPPPNPEHASKVCYECGNRGHIGRDCAIRKARQATQEKTKKPEEPPKQKNEKDAKLVGLISVDGKQDTDKFAKGTLIAMIRQENDEYVVHRINTGALVSKSVKCENVWVDALIDTGAGISVISPQLAERLQLATTGWTGSTIRKANGSKAEPAGKTTISITDGNNTATATVLVMKCSEDIDLLVGTDLLQQFGRVTINFENGTTNTRLGEAKADETEAFMIATLGSDSRRTKLVTRAVATIPPRTTVFVGSRTTKETRGIYMIEPNTNLLRTKAISW